MLYERTKGLFILKVISSGEDKTLKNSGTFLFFSSQSLSFTRKMGISTFLVIMFCFVKFFFSVGRKDYKKMFFLFYALIQEFYHKLIEDRYLPT